MGVRKHEFSTYHVKGNREIKTHIKKLYLSIKTITIQPFFLKRHNAPLHIEKLKYCFDSQPIHNYLNMY